ncbi:MAG: UDP-N-acetylglucosamine 2-epimerase (non-hydrolyzing) [Alphaproteobacteria bacterium]|nr:UDP-N-acetylglucosamine 2-epimerase (non-hydrolyzing) [Alphaproteobacteria bacterium]
MPLKILTIVGNRPQFVKAAAVSRALAERKDELTEVLVHTGQHHDFNMSESFFQELKIPEPAYQLAISGGGHGQMTGRMLEAIEGILEKEKPDWVLVYGDTNSTLAGALAAVKLHFKVAHVEAGLRSFNRAMPEEINRIVTDHVSTLLFCPTKTSIANLAAEGILKGVHMVGDVMFDAALHAKDYSRSHSQIIQKLGLKEGEYALATVHRAENTDNRESLKAVIDYLQRAASACPVVLPLHPRTRKAAADFNIDLKGLIVCEPVGYMDMARLLDGCKMVLTDSGGVQKEAYFHRKPCVTLRSETEWVETIEAGWNRLWTVEDYVKPRQEIADYGQGDAAQKIAGILAGPDKE